MTKAEQKAFIQHCFESLIERRIIKESDIQESNITETQIAHIEEKYHLKFPTLFKTYLTSYHYNFTRLKEYIFDPQAEEYEERCVMITPLPEHHTFETLEGWFCDDGALNDKDGFIKRGYIPFGDWGDGWGPLCLKTSEMDAGAEDCELVWFDHEEYYNFTDVRECENIAMPSFKEFLECYFMEKYSEEDE